MLTKITQKLFKRSESREQEIKAIFITAQLNDKIMPIDRGELYEDILDEFLKANGYGEVTGGGTMQTESGEIEYCDIELAINPKKDMGDICKAIIYQLESLGAPKGSQLIIEEKGEILPFGKKEGLAVYLDGVNLPERVYQECDSNLVLSELSRLIGYNGDVQRYWQGEKETALYFYGDSFEKMNQDISGFVRTYPLCENARIVQIA